MPALPWDLVFTPSRLSCRNGRRDSEHAIGDADTGSVAELARASATTHVLLVTGVDIAACNPQSAISSECNFGQIRR